MRVRPLLHTVATAALTAALATGCSHSPAKPDAPSGTEQQMEQKVGAAESAAAAADADAKGDE
ncbi:hypothetical protein A8W25_01825 [Streptomyces sp. ERV7]|uniref:hypothetical protein n=1 Tax=Streptomyces sp. ERV7 TaxID=1322334 RepID=UPI0007F5508B|nr:hypothetical protein [Streptomyces sp. ERV7]OAR27041.1 hypothetical protein A8W25_01825 [Streptomyces sp. ERV7]